MTQEWKTEFFKALAKKMESFNAENALLKSEENGEWVMQTFLATSTEKKDFVLLQAIPYQARPDVLLLELYIKLLEEVQPSVAGELQEAISELNFYLPVGCLGIYPGNGHVFFRETFRLDTKKALEQVVEDTIVYYEMMMEVVMAAYPGLKGIWSGTLSYREAVEKDLLRKHSK